MSSRALATPLAVSSDPILRSVEYRIPPPPASLWLCQPRTAGRRHAAANSRAVAYIRVSTEEQARLGLSLDAQAERVAAYCTMAGLELVAVLREEGVSASRPLASRPRGHKLLELIAGGSVGHVITLKLDRLFRDACDCLNQTRSWDQQGVALHLVDLGGQTLSTGTAMGRMFLTLVAAFAELERNLISERTAAALARSSASRAPSWGRPRWAGARFVDPTGSGPRSPRTRTAKRCSSTSWTCGRRD